MLFWSATVPHISVHGTRNSRSNTAPSCWRENLFVVSADKINQNLTCTKEVQHWAGCWNWWIGIGERMRHCNQSVRSQRRRWRKTNLACYSSYCFFRYTPMVCSQDTLFPCGTVSDRFLCGAYWFSSLVAGALFLWFCPSFCFGSPSRFRWQTSSPLFCWANLFSSRATTSYLIFFTVSRKVFFRATFVFVRHSIIPSTSGAALCTKFLAKGRPYCFASGIIKIFKPRRSAEPSPLPYWRFVEPE